MAIPNSRWEIKAWPFNVKMQFYTIFIFSTPSFRVTKLSITMHAFKYLLLKQESDSTRKAATLEFLTEDERCYECLDTTAGHWLVSPPIERERSWVQHEMAEQDRTSELWYNHKPVGHWTLDSQPTHEVASAGTTNLTTTQAKKEGRKDGQGKLKSQPPSALNLLAQNAWTCTTFSAVLVTDGPHF